MFIIKVTLVLTVAAGCIGAPRNIYNYNTDSLTGRQSGVPGRAVSGGYSWTAPNGQQVSINYIADKQGYRIVNSQNMFPAQSKSLQDTYQPSHSVFVQKPKPAPKAAVHPHFSVGSSIGSPNAPKYSWPSASPKAQVPAAPKQSSSNHWAQSHFQVAARPRNPTTTVRPVTKSTTVRPTPRPVTVIFFNRPTTSATPVEQKTYHPSQKISSSDAGSPNAISQSEVSDSASASEVEKTDKNAEAKSAKSVSAPEIDEKASKTEPKTTETESEPLETETKASKTGRKASESETKTAEAETAETAPETEANAAESEGAEGEAEAEGGEAEGGEAEGGEEGGEGAEEGEGEGEEEEEGGEESEAEEGGEEEEAEEEEGEESNSEGDEW